MIQSKIEKKPNFFLAGAAKSGTSSLFHYLNEHPQIYMSPVKEPHYLCHQYFPKKFTGPGDEGFSQGVIRTFENYQALFREVKQESIIGEASVYYLYYPDTAKVIKELNPDAKVILVLRNPVERAFSAYLHTVRDGREPLTFEDALEAEPLRKRQGYQPLWWYKEMGLYSAQVQRYLEAFDKEHIRVFLYEDFRPIDNLLANILEFLGVEQRIDVDTSTKHNVSGIPRSRWAYNFFSQPNPVKEVLKTFMPTGLAHRLGEKAKVMTLQKTEMATATRKQLQNYYRKDIQSLQSMIGRDLSRWLG